MTTYIAVQGYRKGQRGALLEDQPLLVTTEDGAIRKAEALARTRAGAVAFMRVADAFDEYAEPRFLAVFGDVPEHIREAFGL